MASGDPVPSLPLGQRPVPNSWLSPLGELSLPGTLTRGGGDNEDLSLLDLCHEPDSFLKRLGGEPSGTRTYRPFPSQDSPAATWNPSIPRDLASSEKRSCGSSFSHLNALSTELPPAHAQHIPAHPLPTPLVDLHILSHSHKTHLQSPVLLSFPLGKTPTLHSPGLGIKEKKGEGRGKGAERKKKKN